MTSTNADETTREKPRRLLSTVVNVILDLVLVLGVAYLVSLGIKKYYSGSSLLPRAAATPHLLRVIESINLGPGHKVHLVAIGQRILLVAQTAQQITLLQDVTQDAVVHEALTGAASAQASGNASFSATLMQLLAQRNPSAPPPAAPVQPSIPLARFAQRQQEAREGREHTS